MIFTRFCKAATRTYKHNTVINTHTRDKPVHSVITVSHVVMLLTLVSGHCVASHTTCMMKCLSV